MNKSTFVVDRKELLGGLTIGKALVHSTRIGPESIVRLRCRNKSDLTLEVTDHQVIYEWEIHPIEFQNDNDTEQQLLLPLSTIPLIAKLHADAVELILGEDELKITATEESKKAEYRIPRLQASFPQIHTPENPQIKLVFSRPEHYWAIRAALSALEPPENTITLSTPLLSALTIFRPPGSEAVVIAGVHRYRLAASSFPATEIQGNETNPPYWVYIPYYAATVISHGQKILSALSTTQQEQQEREVIEKLEQEIEHYDTYEEDESLEELPPSSAPPIETVIEGQIVSSSTSSTEATERVCSILSLTMTTKPPKGKKRLKITVKCPAVDIGQPPKNYLDYVPPNYRYEATVQLETLKNCLERLEKIGGGAPIAIRFDDTPPTLMLSTAGERGIAGNESLEVTIPGETPNYTVHVNPQLAIKALKGVENLTRKEGTEKVTLRLGENPLGPLAIQPATSNSESESVYLLMPMRT